MTRTYWDWYFEISRSNRRVIDGVCVPFPTSEFLAWKEATETIVYPREYDILRAMDEAYCEEVNKELTDLRARRDEARKIEMDKAKSAASKGGKRRR